MNTVLPTTPPQALLLIGPACPHCAALLEVLGKFVKNGAIAQLTVVNVAAMPEPARQLGVRTVPWLRLGEFELEGAHTEGEISQWLQRLNSVEGKSVYLNDLLLAGKLDKAIDLVRSDLGALQSLLLLIADNELDMKVQLGVSAVFEDLQGSDILLEIVDDLGVLSESGHSRVRADVAYFLALTKTGKAIPYLRRLSRDENSDVREIAAEALAELTSSPASHDTPDN
jgi:hypothetical protein